MPSRRFVVWFLVVLAIFLFANTPHDRRTLKSFLVEAGFPWVFAFWKSGQLQSFNVLALMANTALALACASILAYLCSLSRIRSTLRAETINDAV